MAKRRASKRSRVVNGVTATPHDVGDRIIAEALKVAAERLAAHPLEKGRLEACAAEWLGEVLDSEAYLKVTDVEPSTKSHGKAAPSPARILRDHGPS
jgi:hypothetical protein